MNLRSVSLGSLCTASIYNLLILHRYSIPYNTVAIFSTDRAFCTIIVAQNQIEIYNFPELHLQMLKKAQLQRYE